MEMGRLEDLGYHTNYKDTERKDGIFKKYYEDCYNTGSDFKFIKTYKIEFGGLSISEDTVEFYKKLIKQRLEISKSELIALLEPISDFIKSILPALLINGSLYILYYIDDSETALFGYIYNIILWNGLHFIHGGPIYDKLTYNMDGDRYRDNWDNVKRNKEEYKKIKQLKNY